ncbi:reverse transcriptase domain-containing protein [Tanacetum coccineum]|uniref:Reverse transcriptase domain-containing protein n=1 Tax=Tanacetum coccineum TaxID=301880 RepID=A0ABQ4WLR2_9ASTR
MPGGLLSLARNRLEDRICHGVLLQMFLGCVQRVYQVQMTKEDKEKTAFYTEQGTYCYTKMSFDLKNAKASYQRLVDSAFQSQIGRNLESYVDDIVIKSITKKEMHPSQSEEDEGGGRHAISRNPQAYAKDEYRWTKEAEKAFQEIKRLIMELPSLTSLRPKETSVSGVLMAERSGRQTPIWRRRFRSKYQRDKQSVGGETAQEDWTLYIDGASSKKGVGVDLVRIDPFGVEYTYALRLSFDSTNNEEEYEALLAGLRMAN